MPETRATTNERETAPTAAAETGAGPAGGGAYRPEHTEPAIRARWDESGAFHADPARVSDDRPPYSIVIPPPNVTAALHLGHALNNTLQDILIRAHRMMGFETLWMPGTDHAGIATQTVVDRRLKAEGKPALADYKRDEAEGKPGRETFIAQVQQWKDEYERTITEQLKSMGCSCDWARQRFTMDDQCAAAVREAFFRLFKDGLIYRGKRLVNWDPVTQTALADDEVENREVDGQFYYLRYPLVHNGGTALRAVTDQGATLQPLTWGELARRGYPGASDHPPEDQAWVTVATTRPETYLGDTAVAINPNDPRAKALRGYHVQLPLVGRIIPIVEDDYVVMPDPDSADAKAQYATGFLKVTPAHDPNDYDIGRRHQLDIINVMAPDATISDKHGWTDVGDAHIFVGLSREDARKKVVQEFKARALLEDQRPYKHTVGHSYRSHAAIEPYLSDQWYVKVTDDRMRGSALRAMAESQRTTDNFKPRSTNPHDGQLTFHPPRYAKTFETWHENLRDWCISRQLWWGHRIPVWSKRVALTQSNWADELAGKAGLDDVISGAWDTASVTICRVSDGTVVDPRTELMPVVRSTEGEYDIFICSKSDNEMRRFEEHGFVRDPDVLDTWFSSALWPLSTMGWPDPEKFPESIGLLEAFNPTSVLCTAREIITLWVSRMVMFNRYFTGEHSTSEPAPPAPSPQPPSSPGQLPFKDVFIHAMIQDGEGRKMSKSLGNGVDPRDIIASHGADAMRFTLCHMTTQTQDVRMPVAMVCPHCGEMVDMRAQEQMRKQPIETCRKCKGTFLSQFAIANNLAQPTKDLPAAKNTSPKFDLGRNFCNKVWNSARFALGILEKAKDVRGNKTPASAALQPPASSLKPASLIDRWMLSRLAASVADAEAALREYQFATYAQILYDLHWRDFCDWYLEGIKPTVEHDPTQRAVLRTALDAILRLAHPVLPFITEAIFEKLHPPDTRGTGVSPVTAARSTGVPPVTVAGINLESRDLLCTSGWPRIEGRELRDEGAEQRFERTRALVTAIREVRAQHNVPPRRKITLYLPPAVAREAEIDTDLVMTLAGLEAIEAEGPESHGSESRATMVAFTFEAVELHLGNLADAVDAGAERARLEKQIADLGKSIAALEGRLNNPGYASKAPAHLVQQTRDELEQKQRERAAAAEATARL